MEQILATTDIRQASAMPSEQEIGGFFGAVYRAIHLAERIKAAVHDSDGWRIDALEGVEAQRANLAGPCSRDEPAIERDIHAVELVEAGGREGGQQVDARVGQRVVDRKLRAGEDNGLGEVFKEERKRRGSVGHRVCAVQNDEAIVLIIVSRDDAHELCPFLGGHVAGIYGWGELIDINVGLDQLELRHGVYKMVEIKGFQSACVRILTHADSATGVDQQYFIHLPNLFCANIVKSLEISNILYYFCNNKLIFNKTNQRTRL